MDRPQERYADFVRGLESTSGNLCYQGSEGGHFPALVVYREQRGAGAANASYALSRVLADYAVFTAMSGSGESVVVPLGGLIVVREGAALQ